MRTIPRSTITLVKRHPCLRTLLFQRHKRIRIKVKNKKRSHKGPKKTTETSTAKRLIIPWTKEEKIALCRSWIEISEDRRAADYLQRKVF